MASILKGTVTIPASTGALSKITCTDPKAIVLWGTYQTTAGEAAADRHWGVGFGTYLGGSVQQCYAACWGDDGLSVSTYAESVNSDALLRGLSAVATVDFEIDLVSMVSDGVNLTVADAPGTGNIVLHYWIVCGSEITAEAKQFALSTASATQDVTLTSGMGNPGDGEPWLSLFFKAQRTSTGQADANIGLSLGFDNGTDKAATLWGGDTGASNMTVAGWQKPGRSILGFTGTIGSADTEASIDSSGHPTDGFQLAFADQASVACLVSSLHIRGLGSVIGETTSRTSAGNQTITVGETPIGALFAGNALPVSTSIDTTHASLGAQWLGGTDFTTEGAAGMLEDDGITHDNGIMWHSTTQAVEMRGAIGSLNTSELLAAADASISGTDVQLAYTTAPGTARGILHLVVYEVAGGPVEHERSASVAGTGTIATVGQRALQRSATVTGTGAIATAGQRALLRSAAVAGTGAISVSGEFFSVLERSATVAGTGAISTSGQRDLHRQVGVAGTGTIVVAGEVEGPGATTHSRSASLSGTGAITVAAQQRDLLRAVALTGTGAISSAGRRDLLRSVTVTGTGLIATGRQLEANRSAALSGTGLIAVSGQAVGPIQPVGNLEATLAVSVPDGTLAASAVEATSSVALVE